MFTLLLYNNQRKRLRSSSGPFGCVKSADDWESKAKEKVVAFFTRFPLRFFFLYSCYGAALVGVGNDAGCARPLTRRRIHRQISQLMPRLSSN